MGCAGCVGSSVTKTHEIHWGPGQCGPVVRCIKRVCLSVCLSVYLSIYLSIYSSNKFFNKCSMTARQVVRRVFDECATSVSSFGRTKMHWLSPPKSKKRRFPSWVPKKETDCLVAENSTSKNPIFTSQRNQKRNDFPRGCQKRNRLPRGGKFDIQKSQIRVLNPTAFAPPDANPSAECCYEVISFLKKKQHPKIANPTFKSEQLCAAGCASERGIGVADPPPTFRGRIRIRAFF